MSNDNGGPAFPHARSFAEDAALAYKEADAMLAERRRRFEGGAS